MSMLALLGVTAALLVPPPPQAGAWQQLGAALTSKPGKQLHFFRIDAKSPKALGVVATSRSPKRISLHWWSYCEFQSDDEMTGETQATVSGVHTVVAYPPVLDGATLCYVSVVTRVAGGKVAAAIFRY